MNKENSPIIRYRYTFILGEDRRKTFELHLDRATLALQPHEAKKYVEWTELACCQCPNCPLNESRYPQCPIAANIIDLVSFFTDVSSYKQLDVEIATDERSYTKHTTTSEAVSSLLGIYMVTSGCPIMDKLRPMVRFHLPLATTEETTFKAVAMYLMAQYFVQQQGGKPDWTLSGLQHIYSEIQTVNRGFVQRLQRATDSDASINALVRLDTYAIAVVMSIDLKRLNKMAAMFEAFFPSR